MIRSNRHGTQEWRWYLPRHGLSHGVHGGTRGIGIRGIMHRTGATDITGTTIITTGTETAIREESGTEDATCTTVRGTPPVHTAREVHRYPAPEASPVRPYPETPYPEFPAAGLQGSRR